jgi:hypothetical protein
MRNKIVATLLLFTAILGLTASDGTIITTG